VHLIWLNLDADKKMLKMKFTYLLSCLFGISITATSCKNESKNPTEEIEVKAEVKSEKNKQSNSNIDEIPIRSIMAKAMMTPELNTFISFIVTTEKIDMLGNEESPYTIFAPNNEAFDLIDENRMNFFKNPANREQLNHMIQSHIVSGLIDSSSIIQSIKDGNGTYEIVTLSGTVLTASQDGTDIILTDSGNKKGVIGKSDIIGTNGVLHVLNSVLESN
jgi:uncharacterized surface protein with fasciclin (FAS1) repeats